MLNSIVFKSITVCRKHPATFGDVYIDMFDLDAGCDDVE